MFNVVTFVSVVMIVAMAVCIVQNNRAKRAEARLLAWRVRQIRRNPLLPMLAVLLLACSPAMARGHSNGSHHSSGSHSHSHK